MGLINTVHSHAGKNISVGKERGTGKERLISCLKDIKMGRKSAGMNLICHILILSPYLERTVFIAILKLKRLGWIG
jgi:hypothetical protein